MRYAKGTACAVDAGAAFTLLGAVRTQARQKQLAGQVVLITGGSRGFGLALALEFASLRCRIALCARDYNGLERVQETHAHASHEVFTLTCDISDRDGVMAMVNAVSRHYSHIDILVNNAGEIMVSPFDNLELADFERPMAVMFWGILYTTLAVLPLMKARGPGRIVNVTSIGGKRSVSHLLSYSCAKAAAAAFSNGLRNEVRQVRHRRNYDYPGMDAKRLARKRLPQGKSCGGSWLVFLNKE